MTTGDIIAVIICSILGVIWLYFWFCILYSTVASQIKRQKGEKMRKSKKITLDALEEQQQMIKELKDKIEYLELKENGAEILWGKYTSVRYVYDSEIKEISIGGDFQVYNKEEETDEYIILQSIGRIGNYDIEKWEQVTTSHIIDKSTGKMYDAQELNEELERYNEMQKMLNEFEEENKREGE